LDVNNYNEIENIVKNNNIDCLIHLSALVSAASEKYPEKALKLNTEGLHNILKISNLYKLKIYTPSSIAAFGDHYPKNNTPDFTVQRPRGILLFNLGIYGIGKVYAELLGEYYNIKHGVDFRCLRYPGIISWKTLPGGGTTDYAVDIFHSAVKGEVYECFLKPDSELPMMYMPVIILTINH
jgi:threonine 3-dehydrogenase